MIDFKKTLVSKADSLHPPSFTKRTKGVHTYEQLWLQETVHQCNHFVLTQWYNRHLHVIMPKIRQTVKKTDARKVNILRANFNKSLPCVYFVISNISATQFSCHSILFLLVSVVTFYELLMQDMLDGLISARHFL